MTIQLLITILVVVLSLLAQHYFPWGMLLRRRLPRLAAYTLGMLGVILPLSGLYLYWSAHPPVWIHAHLFALWAATIAGGLAVTGAYALDALLAQLVRLRELEERLNERQADGSGAPDA